MYKVMWQYIVIIEISLVSAVWNTLIDVDTSKNQLCTLYSTSTKKDGLSENLRSQPFDRLMVLLYLSYSIGKTPHQLSPCCLIG